MTLAQQRADIDVRDLVRGDRVHRRLYTDPAIFDAEMHAIFEHTWVFIGHASEVPEAGDYKTTYIGRNPVVMVRDRDAQIQVLMNRCMHRGALICREERGNTSGFRCSYHGWTYNTRGELVVVTSRSGYGPELEQEKLGLIRAPLVEDYRGFVFASLDPGVMPLTDHLGAAKRYLDLGLDLSPSGEIAARSGAQRYGYPANWKFQIENWTDHYHAAIVHETAFAISGRGGARSPRVPDPVTGEYAERDTGWVTSLPHGINTEKTRGAAGLKTFAGAALPGGDVYLEQLVARRGAERANELVSADIQIMIFPNFFIQPRRQHFRVLRPVAVDRTEIWAYPYTLTGVPDEYNQKMVEDVAWWASAAGFGQPDDLEQFVRCQEGLQVTAAEWVLINRAMHLEENLPGGEIKGESETTMRGIYREWARLMERHLC
jgi:phenylpropionate dioxygenase-like ring-hydroxylating dioxygenase large terminal subunit